MTADGAMITETVTAVTGTATVGGTGIRVTDDATDSDHESAWPASGPFSDGPGAQGYVTPPGPGPTPAVRPGPGPGPLAPNRDRTTVASG